MTAERGVILLVVIIVVAMVARRLRIPYTVGLVLAGLGLGATGQFAELRLTKELIFSFLLPPLVFEAALYIRWSKLRKDLVPIVVFGTVGLLIATCVVAFGLTWSLQWSLPVAFIFATLISATDPVSVIASFREAGAKGRVPRLVEAESLMNDGTAAVAFAIALACAQNMAPSPIQAVGQFLLVALGGIVVGLAVAGVGILLAGRTNDSLVEIAITVAVAYGSFLAAEHFHLSGILAASAAGLLVGNIGNIGSFHDENHSMVTTFWEVVAFASNSIIFLLIGVKQAQVPLGQYVGSLAVALGLVLLGRAVSVYGCALAFHRTGWKIPAIGQHLLFWGGLRGALALALVLGLPEGFPQRDQLTSICFGVVVFSVVVQGLSISPLVKRAVTAS
jgi:CPA1 family monovalent cation:H+ antiporter